VELEEYDAPAQWYPSPASGKPVPAIQPNISSDQDPLGTSTESAVSTTSTSLPRSWRRFLQQEHGTDCKTFAVPGHLACVVDWGWK